MVKDRILLLMPDHAHDTNVTLARMLGVSIVAIDKALKRLERDGLIKRHRMGRRRIITLQ